jgi:hypothetical protein
MKRQFGGVPIGADRDPTIQANNIVKSKACFRFEWGPASVLIYSQLAIGQHSFDGAADHVGGALAAPLCLSLRSRPIS